MTTVGDFENILTKAGWKMMDYFMLHNKNELLNPSKEFAVVNLNEKCQHGLISMSIVKWHTGYRCFQCLINKIIKKNFTVKKYEFPLLLKYLRDKQGIGNVYYKLFGYYRFHFTGDHILNVGKKYIYEASGFFRKYYGNNIDDYTYILYRCDCDNHCYTNDNCKNPHHRFIKLKELLTEEKCGMTFGVRGITKLKNN